MSVYDLLSPWIPEPYSGYVWPAYLSATALAGARFSVVRHEGTLRGSGLRGSFDAIARADWLGAHFAERLFEPGSTAALTGSCSVYGIRGGDADLTIALVSRWLSRRVFGERFVRMPSWIGHMAAAPVDSAARRTILDRTDDDVRRTRRRKFRYEIDRSPDSVAGFHRDFYLPTIARRHGESAWTYSPALFHRESRNGAILWVMSGEDRIAGIFFQTAPPVIRVRASAVAGGDLELIQKGAMAACYVFLFQAANELGCQWIDYRGTRPSQNDGVFRYKQKWGAKLYDSAVTSIEDIGVHWPRPSATVDAFLREYAPVFRCAGGLAAVDTGSPRIPDGISMLAPLDNPGDTAAFLAATTARKPPK